MFREWKVSIPTGQFPAMLLMFGLMLMNLRAAEAGDKPGYLQSYVEKETGCRITRVSGEPGTSIPKLPQKRTWSDEVRHHYSLDQAWNADQTLLALDRNRNGCPNLLLNGRTFEVISEWPSFPFSSRWHPLKPTVRIYMGGREVGYFDVLSGQKTSAASFDEYRHVRLDSKSNVSDDGKMVAVLAERSDGQLVAFAYDLSGKVKHPEIPLARSSKKIVAEHQYCTISPSGKYIVEDDGDDVRTVYDLAGRRIFTTERANPTHCDLGYDQAGFEVIVGRSNRKPYEGRLIMRRLVDGTVTVLNGPQGEKLGCGHVSMRSVHRPGWAYCSGVFYPPYAGWVIAVKLDTSGTVEKLAQIPNKWSDYPTEMHASPSWDGHKVIVAGNWNAPSGRPVQAYVIELP
jgi:hypothetical protein